MEQMKQDFQQLLAFKSDLEQLIEEQTHQLEKKNKKIFMIEETLNFKDQEIDKKDNLLRRVSQSADETKKNLMKAEVKLRQVT